MKTEGLRYMGIDIVSRDHGRDMRDFLVLGEETI